MIEVLDYDRRWPEFAAVASSDIMGALDGRLSRVEHVGSTAVPGLAAKPIIDLMAATARGLADIAAHDAALRELGYQLIETGMPERLFYRCEGQPVAYHLHVVTDESWDSRNERILRDHLREDLADVERYAALKRQLAGSGHDPDSYTRAKTTLIQQMVDRARARRGMALVPVWEE